MFSNANYLWANYWKQLSVMLDAGLTIESALQTLVGSTSFNGKRIDDKLSRIILLVRQGQSLSKSLKQTNSIDDADFKIVNIAEQSGKLPQGLNAIADRRIDWVFKVNNLKANLLLPKGLLLVGALAGLFVRTASAGQTFQEASTAVITTLAIAWLFIMLTVWLVQRDLLVWLSLGWRIRLLRDRWKTYQLVFEDAFYRLLIWQIEAGITPDRALNACKTLLSAPDYQAKVSSAETRVLKGDSVDTVMIESALVLSKPLKRVLLTSIQVGTWDRTIAHHLNLQKQVLNLQADNFFKWLPRLYYFIALLAISKFMFPGA